ncbi:unnamed protein product [Sympodiomycopsis kandeliae]
MDILHHDSSGSSVDAIALNNGLYLGNKGHAVSNQNEERSKPRRQLATTSKHKKSTVSVFNLDVEDSVDARTIYLQHLNRKLPPSPPSKDFQPNGLLDERTMYHSLTSRPPK